METIEEGTTGRSRATRNADRGDDKAEAVKAEGAGDDKTEAVKAEGAGDDKAEAVKAEGAGDDKTEAVKAEGAGDDKTEAVKGYGGNWDEMVLIVTTTQNGFRRGGREWHGVTEVAVSEFTEAQLEQLRDEPRLHIIVKP
jgi:hypothetical protein